MRQRWTSVISPETWLPIWRRRVVFTLVSAWSVDSSSHPQKNVWKNIKGFRQWVGVVVPCAHADISSLRFITNRSFCIQFGKYMGVESHILSPEESKKLYPLMNIDDVEATLYSPTDGHIDPAGYCMSLSRAAKNNGAKVVYQPMQCCIPWILDYIAIEMCLRSWQAVLSQT